MKKTLIIMIMVTIIIAMLFAIVMIKMIRKNGECLDNPFSYSAKRLKESGGEYLCSCKSLVPELLDFYFDEKGINIIKPNEYVSSTQMKGGNLE